MLNLHDRFKEGHKLGTAIIRADHKFKKEYQVVDRPKVTDHDMHEDYTKHPPHVNDLSCT